jgi:hypothetical protein
VKAGWFAVADGTVTFGETRKLRSAQERLDVFAIYPVLGSKPIGHVKRSDIVRLLHEALCPS